MRPVQGRESRRRRSFQTPGNPLTGGSVGSFGILQGNITGREKKEPTAYALAATSSREVAQTLELARSRLKREVQDAGLG